MLHLDQNQVGDKTESARLARANIRRFGCPHLELKDILSDKYREKIQN